MVVRSRARERITVQLSEGATARQVRELGAFVRYCIRRIEREFGEKEAWIVDLGPPVGAYRVQIAVRDRGVMLEESVSGYDATLAIWEAMCRLEQRLRERPITTFGRMVC